jgi:alkanesulfonate monooxygenase SsuD/methylene tetrahydromethanopterin reductase-like flavin-dependent oxidoreductase (luciferase family)
VGSLVYDNDVRHPALLAQEVATIDLLTGGRFDFGIGAGWLKKEDNAAGISFDPGGVRVERLDESLRIMKQLFCGSALTPEGRPGEAQTYILNAGTPAIGHGGQ